MAPRLRLIVLLLVVAACAVGCNIVAPATYLIAGPPKIPAEYILEDRPTLVFVDDRGNAMASNANILRAAVAETTSQELMERAGLSTTISPRDAIAYAASRDRHQNLIAMDELGRAVGADQIIYVQMMTFRDTDDGVSPRPIAACQVRVLDVVNRVRLFPAEEEQQAARPVSVKLPPVDPSAFRTQSNRLKIHRALAEELGEEIAKIFYKHEYKDVGERLERR
jgi:hypothetical protein